MLVELMPHDFDAVWLLETRAHRWPWPKKIMEQQLQKPHCNYGLFNENFLIGMVLLQKIFPEAEILNIAVLPQHQGQGFGKRLLNSIIETLINEKYQHLFLEVRASNQAAIHLYESTGFNQIGERANYYPAEQGREDALLYAKELLF